jgi:thimet oligopeptidase
VHPSNPAPFFLATLVAASFLAACAPEPPPESAKAATNQTSPGKPAPAAAGQTGPERYAARCEAAALEARQMLAALEAGQEAATIESVLRPYNDLLVALFDPAQEGSLLSNVHPDEAMRDAAAACEQTFEVLNSERLLSRPLYERLARVDVSGADDKTRYFVERTLREFRLKGVDQDEATRARIRTLAEEITALGQRFDRNIAEDVRSISVDSAADLAGLPADWVDAHPPEADGKIRITTNYPDYIPFMRYAESDELRRALYIEYNNRGYPANESVLKDLIVKRTEQARLQGFENWADLALADKMIGDGRRAATFIEDGSAGALPRARQDYEMLLARLREDEPDAVEVMPWQTTRLSEAIRQETYELSSEELRPYFRYDRVRDGIFDLTSRMYGVSFRPGSEDGTWDESVEAWEMLDGDEIVGRFYLDMHPRDGKYKHAAHFYKRAGLADGRIPESALVCNFPGERGKPAYMEKDQVETFLHEFGHLVHYLFRYHQPWLGISQPERDFIEAPSMMLEEWIYDAPTLQSFAVNDAGDAIPAELVGKMRAARDFGQGLFVHRQLFLAAISLNFYNRDPASFELEPLYRSLAERYSLIPHVDGTHMYTAFGHLNGYSAFYYTYMWSLAMAYDMFGRFEAAGLNDRAVALDYRDKVLAVGGSKPAADFVSDFLGRPYDFRAFKRRLNSADATASP